MMASRSHRSSNTGVNYHKKREMVNCPLNNGHLVPKDSLEKHLTSCSWRMEGYCDEDVPLPENHAPDGTKIVIDIDLRRKLILDAAANSQNFWTGFPPGESDDRPIPRTGDRIVSDFTVDERRALYDYAVSKTGSAPILKVEDFNLPFQKEKQQRPKTFIEVLAEERDAKRRKMSKKVHTNRKSHTEILREVILNQMEVYEEFLKLESEGYRSDASRKSSESYKDERNHSPSRKTGSTSNSSRRELSNEFRSDEQGEHSRTHSKSPSYSFKHGNERNHKRFDYNKRDNDYPRRDRNMKEYNRLSGKYENDESMNYTKRSQGSHNFRSQERSDSCDTSHYDRSESEKRYENRYYKDTLNRHKFKDRSNSYDSQRGKKLQGRSYRRNDHEGSNDRPRDDRRSDAKLSEYCVRNSGYDDHHRHSNERCSVSSSRRTDHSSSTKFIEYRREKRIRNGKKRSREKSTTESDSGTEHLSYDRSRDTESYTKYKDRDSGSHHRRDTCDKYSEAPTSHSSRKSSKKHRERNDNVHLSRSDRYYEPSYSRSSRKHSSQYDGSDSTQEEEGEVEEKDDYDTKKKYRLERENTDSSVSSKAEQIHRKHGKHKRKKHKKLVHVMEEKVQLVKDAGAHIGDEFSC